MLRLYRFPYIHTILSNLFINMYKIHLQTVTTKSDCKNSSRSLREEAEASSSNPLPYDEENSTTIAAKRASVGS